MWNSGRVPYWYQNVWIRKGQTSPGEKQQSLLLGQENSSLNRKTNTAVYSKLQFSKQQGSGSRARCWGVRSPLQPTDTSWRTEGVRTAHRSCVPINPLGKTPLMGPLNEQFHTVLCKFKIKIQRAGYQLACAARPREDQKQRSPSPGNWFTTT